MKTQEERTELCVTAILRIAARHHFESMVEDILNFEVQTYIDRHNEKHSEGKKGVVRNGTLPPRTIHTSFGPLTIRRPRVRDRRPEEEQRVFRSQLVKKFQQNTVNSKGVIILINYLLGLVGEDMKSMLPYLFGRNIPRMVEEHLCKKWKRDLQDWKENSLATSCYDDVIPIQIDIRSTQSNTTLFILIGRTWYEEYEIIDVYLRAETQDTKSGWNILFERLKKRQGYFDNIDEILQNTLRLTWESGV